VIAQNESIQKSRHFQRVFDVQVKGTLNRGDRNGAYTSLTIPTAFYMFTSSISGNSVNGGVSSGQVFCQLVNEFLCGGVT
jgi:hypothetical protein